MGVSSIRCLRCKQDLPTSEFNKNASRKDGFQAYCKTCKLAANRASRNRRQGNSVPVEKRCSKCRGMFPAANFYRDLAQKAGLSSWCSECINTKNSNLTAARHAENPLKNLPLDRKYCPKCKRVRDREFFGKSQQRKDGRTGWCRDCVGESQKLRRKRQPKRFREVHRRGALKYRLKQYGLTPEDYEGMIRAQKNRCAICGSPPRDSRAQDPVLHIDHCHNTGRVRGLLCAPCNHGLGHFDDDPRRVLLAARYLVKHRKAVL